MKTRIRILANDPGKTNYGLAVIDVFLDTPLTVEQRRPKNNKFPLRGLKFQVLHTRKLQNCYTELKFPTQVQNETLAYIREIAAAASEYQVDFMIAERYQSRRMGGTTIELVNQMIGTLRGIACMKEAPLKVIPASQWKVPLGHQGFDLEALYKRAKLFKISDHEVDACFIGLYGAFTLMRRRPFFMEDVNSLEVGVLRDLKRLTKGGPAGKPK